MTISPSYPFNLQNGTPADATQVMANFLQIQNDVNANAAASGANSDITSLTGLTTPLGIAYGGTGAITAPAALLALGGAPIASPTFTGVPAGPTAAPGTSTTQLATTEFVAVSFAPLASPTFTGVPAAPTAAPGTNTTQIATTAFVTAAASGRILTIAVQEFNSSGTYTPTANMVFCFVEGVAAGGGGGPASGGGAGEYGWGLFTAVQIGANKAVTIPAGATTGNNGGNTSLGALLTMVGGSAGTGNPNGVGGTGGTGGTGGNGHLDGGDGWGGVTSQLRGGGGSSYYGGCGGAGYNTTGTNAKDNTGGGGGNGASGGSGYLRIVEFCT